MDKKKIIILSSIFIVIIIIIGLFVFIFSTPEEEKEDDKSRFIGLWFCYIDNSTYQYLIYYENGTATSYYYRYGYHTQPVEVNFCWYLENNKIVHDHTLNFETSTARTNYYLSYSFLNDYKELILVENGTKFEYEKQNTIEDMIEDHEKFSDNLNEMLDELSDE